jgi:Pretoxin HINT domain
VQTIVSNTIHPYFVQLPEGATAPPSSERHVYDGRIARGAWVDASNLKAGYRLLNDDGSWAEVTGITVEQAPLKAYNLTIEGYHTFFVSGNAEANPVWVHNNNCNIDANGLPVPAKAVNTGLDHAANRAALPDRGVFSTSAQAKEALKNLSDSISRNGFPSGTIRDTTRADSFLVPVGSGGYAVYRLQKNGTAVLKTVLKAR